MSLFVVCWFCKERSVADVSWEGHSSTNKSDKSGPPRFLVADFICSAKSKVSVMSLPNFRVSAWVFLAKILFM